MKNNHQKKFAKNNRGFVDDLQSLSLGKDGLLISHGQIAGILSQLGLDEIVKDVHALALTFLHVVVHGQSLHAGCQLL